MSPLEISAVLKEVRIYTHFNVTVSPATINLTILSYLDFNLGHQHNSCYFSKSTWVK